MYDKYRRVVIQHLRQFTKCLIRLHLQAVNNKFVYLIYCATNIMNNSYTISFLSKVLIYSCDTLYS